MTKILTALCKSIKVILFNIYSRVFLIPYIIEVGKKCPTRKTININVIDVQR